MGRRRRRVIRIVKRTLPKVYQCPQCGMISVRVTVSEKSNADVACGSCGLRVQYDLPSKKEAIDIYNMFVDEFTKGKVGG